MRRTTKRLVLLSLVACFVGVNVIAYMQARAMTHFASVGSRTKRPEELSAFEAARVIGAGVTIPRPRSGNVPGDVGLPFEVRRFSSANGVTLDSWYVPGTVDDSIVLLFHGYAAAKGDLVPVARAIHELGHSVLLVDFYGSGDSSGSDTSLGFLESRDVAAAVRYARQTWPKRKVVLYGFSMGGAAILRAIAVDSVTADGIILEATFDTLLNTAKNRFSTMGLPATPFAQLLLFWGGVEWGFDAFSHNPVEYAAAVDCPALILHGGMDARVPPGQAQNLARALVDSRLVTFPGVGHMLIVNARKNEWKDAVSTFLAES